MKKNKNEKNDSRYQVLVDLLKKIQEKFSQTGEKEIDQKLKVAVAQNVGEFAEVFMDIAINATSADLALMTTQVKTLANAAKIGLLSLSPAERERNANTAVLVTLIVDTEKTVQGYFAFKAAQLRGGKTANKALLDLIQANTPKE